MTTATIRIPTIVAAFRSISCESFFGAVPNPIVARSPQRGSRDLVGDRSGCPAPALGRPNRKLGPRGFPAPVPPRAGAAPRFATRAVRNGAARSDARLAFATNLQAASRTSTVICLPRAARAAWIFSAFDACSGSSIRRIARSWTPRRRASSELFTCWSRIAR
jgi:hypothetical protein